MLTAELDYSLPSESVAQSPIEPRHASRLLDTRSFTDHKFSDLPDLLRADDLLVLNRTRVRAARLVGRKSLTGGRVEALLARRLSPDRWEALVRPARRLRAGVVVEFGPLQGELVSSPVDGVAELVLRGPGDVEELVEKTGQVPLPPYINRSLQDAERYQTVFASRLGSAAAPTAGLHFTPVVLDGLRRRGVRTTEIDLEVGWATFRPIGVERLEEHPMGVERFRIPEEAEEAVRECRERGGRVVAVGTTVVRTLETAAASDRLVTAQEGDTDLYLTPGCRFRVVDLLITNFHAPRSSLVALVWAFMGERWREAYRIALARGYRFLSFGDAMLAERDPAMAQP
ncbi:MAG: tRNA preQ1(34) S-adenosylmethionine ribosyltransferase-isomerase QueA [bacterium]|nr:tRNA preQ1(34) S-adenosylmethionine ribosyltransferase-isomerase QueA [Acidimicrobiia bacterium]MCY4649726.1 tRNA preQ1(34) S-adenosylmethionine ribosyltransferase-isomerase QueA [bacterium]